MKNSINLINPPWKLTGSGSIFIYSLQREQRQAMLDNKYEVNGLTVLMLVRYESSPIGTYDECLLIPGKIKQNGRSGYHISHIHVSTAISTLNGKEHWGIPKVTSEFEWNIIDKGYSSSIMDNDHRFTHLKVTSHGLSIPIFTHWLPYRLLQSNNNSWCSIRPTASGTMKMAKLKGFESSMPGFEHLNGIRPALGIHIPSFHMTFPVGKWLDSH